MVAAASTTKIGVPVACGAALRTASTKRRRTWLSLASPFGATSILTSPSGAIQALLSSAGREFVRHRLDAQEIAHLLEHRLERRRQEALDLFPCCRRGLGERGEGFGQPAGLSGGRGIDARRHAREVARSLVNRRQRLGRRRRRLDQVRVHRVLEKEIRVIDQGELLVLVLRDEARERTRVRDLGQSLQRLRGLRRFSQVGLQYLDGVGARVRIAHQVEERGDRLDLLRAKVQGIEIEAQILEQRQAENDGAERQPDDPGASTVEEMVERRQRHKADRRPLAGGFERREQRREQGYGRHERDDHACSRNQAKLRQAHIGGRKKRIEGGGDRGRCEQQRPRDAVRRRLDRLAEVVGLEPLSAVTHAELNAEIDAQSDEQDGEGNRDEIQRPDHP